MTPHKPYQLENIRSISELDVPVQNPRPVPEIIECYLHDTSGIKSGDIIYWKQVPDFDVYKVLLKDGRTFEISGPAIEFYAQTSID